MPKNIVVFADGTGNGASALAKTNVWRLYRAVDLAQPVRPGDPLQVAFYIDGVGTSAFRPLALLESVFGIGVARNAREMYKFICRNYAPGDRIFAFGFSRGAFTARVLCGLIASQGIVRYSTEEELERAVRDAYRANRRRYKLPLFTPKDSSKPRKADDVVGLVDLIRKARDGAIHTWRAIARRFGKSSNESSAPLQPYRPHVAFLGVWDTVSAYGLPIEELTRGIDNWVWPLSMPDYLLSEKVDCARHALALDEERDSFQPLLWDERGEAALLKENRIKPDRLKQVWFPGVHANVGGGYADDTLSLVPLEWMMDEAAKAGLRFLPAPQQEPRPPANPFGRRYDSRSGVAAYYRYQPRKLSARLTIPDPTTRLQQNPSRRDRGFLESIVIHESAMERVRLGTDHYAPIGLPAEFRIIDRNGSLTPHTDQARAARQEWVWNDVWRRRVNYFSVVIASVALASLPIVQSYYPPAACLGPQCALAPWITGLGMFLPSFAQWWLDAFAKTPAISVGIAILIMLPLGRSTMLERRIRDGARELWAQSLNLPLPAGAPRTPAGRSKGRPRDWIYLVRTNRLYQRTFQYLKWWLFPGVFGISLLAGGAAVFAFVLAIMVGRFELAIGERNGTICDLGSTGGASGDLPAGTFSTRQICWKLGDRLIRKARYRITMEVAQPWRDDTISTDPGGFGNDRMPAPAKFGAYLVRRSATDRWFQPVLRISRSDGTARLQALEFRCACGSAVQSSARATYTAEVIAEEDGEAGLFVNDGIVAVPFVTKARVGLTTEFYDNNRGLATVRIDLVDPPPSEPKKPWWRFW